MSQDIKIHYVFLHNTSSSALTARKTNNGHSIKRREPFEVSFGSHYDKCLGYQLKNFYTDCRAEARVWENFIHYPSDKRVNLPKVD